MYSCCDMFRDLTIKQNFRQVKFPFPYFLTLPICQQAILTISSSEKILNRDINQYLNEGLIGSMPLLIYPFRNMSILFMKFKPYHCDFTEIWYVPLHTPSKHYQNCLDQNTLFLPSSFPSSLFSIHDRAMPRDSGVTLTSGVSWNRLPLFGSTQRTSASP